MSTIALNPTQVGQLAQIEFAVAMLRLLGRSTPGGLSGACIVAAKTLEKAHEEFVAETQRTVSIAAPADIAKMVAP